MSETAGGDHEGQAPPSEGVSTRDGPESEVIEVAPGKTMAVITPKLVYKINGDTQDVYDVLAETTKSRLMTLSCRSVIDDKGLVRRPSCTLAVYTIPSLQPMGYRVVL